MTTDPRKLEDLRWVCHCWWWDLNGISKDGNENRDRSDRKSRAELRRISSIASDDGNSVDFVAAYAVEPFRDFFRTVQEKAPRIEADRVALAALTLAHVEHDRLELDEEGNGWTTAKLLGKSRSIDSKEPKFAEARFKRLIRTNDPAELLPQMVRAVKILDKTAPVGELGASLLLWGPAVKKRWAFAYWQKTYIPPEQSEQTETQDAA
jgi:CRISPR type I-E-associated protein CasB/Cse2